MSAQTLPFPDPPPEPHAAGRPHLRALDADSVESEPTEYEPSPHAAHAVFVRGFPPLTHRNIGTIAVFAFEAVEGSRHVAQLGKWITYPVSQQLLDYRALTLERRALYRDARRLVPSVRTVRVMVPRTRVVEATVVLDISNRCRAVAIRFEATKNRWQATSITIL